MNIFKNSKNNGKLWHGGPSFFGITIGTDFFGKEKFRMEYFGTDFLGAELFFWKLFFWKILFGTEISSCLLLSSDLYFILNHKFSSYFQKII